LKSKGQSGLRGASSEGHLLGARRGRGWLALAVALLCWVSAGQRSARAEPGQPPLPPAASSINQYRESLPTSSGAVPVDRQSARQVAKLPATASTSLKRDAGKDAQALTDIATSSLYGAPSTEHKLPRAEGVAGAPSRAAALPVPASRSIWRAASDASDVDDGIVVLALLLLATLAGAVGARRGTPVSGSRR
jgi:hypothetical protein